MSRVLLWIADEEWELNWHAHSPTKELPLSALSKRTYGLGFDSEPRKESIATHTSLSLFAKI